MAFQPAVREHTFQREESVRKKRRGPEVDHMVGMDEKSFSRFARGWVNPARDNSGEKYRRSNHVASLCSKEIFFLCGPFLKSLFKLL